MAKKVLARGWTFEINTGTEAVPNWVKIGGLRQHSLTAGKTDANTTDYDDQGNATHLVAERTRSWSLEGNYLEDKLDGTRDPGQEAVEELAEKIDDESLGDFQVTSPGGTIYTFKASASVDGLGGSSNDPTNWRCTLTVSGAITKS